MVTSTKRNNQNMYAKYLKNIETFKTKKDF